jgi:hypothetical protein
MVSARSLLHHPLPGWPPDDTEESVVGTDWHQTTITNLRLGINEIARAQAGPTGPVPWQASGQIMILGFWRTDRSPYTVLPDVFVYHQQFDRHLGSLSLAQQGLPGLIVEVASPSTYEADLDFVAGKGWAYAQAGVPEYVTLDPYRLFLPAPLSGWQLEGTSYQACELDAQGRWWSQEFAFGLGVRDGLVTVYNRSGEPQLREGEIGTAMARRDAALDRQSTEIERQKAEIAELRRRVQDLEGR